MGAENGFDDNWESELGGRGGDLSGVSDDQSFGYGDAEVVEHLHGADFVFSAEDG